MKAFVKKNQSTLVSLAVIASIFVFAAAVALLFNEVTPSMLLRV